MQRISWARLQFRDEMEIERTRFIVLGMNEEPAAADRLVKGNEPEDDVGEECGPEALAFVAFVDAETCEERDRLRIPSGASTHPRGYVCKCNLRHAPPVVCDDIVAVVFGDYEDLGRASSR